MSVRLLIGNLSGTVNNLRLEQLFARHGEVQSASVATGEGVGFIQMSCDEDARRAISALHGHVIDGYAMSVCVCDETPDDLKSPVVRPRPRYGNGRTGGGCGSRFGRLRP